MAGEERVLNAAYAAFNARDLDAAIELMHPEVDRPNAWEGGPVSAGKRSATTGGASSRRSAAGSSPRGSARRRAGASRSRCTRWSTTRKAASC